MRNKILELIQANPKHYSVLIKKNVEMHDWVNKNSRVISEHFPTMIYSAVYDVSPICEHGQIKKLSRWSSGLSNCGPAKNCQCTKSSIATNVSISKKEYTAEKREEIEKRRTATMLELYGVQYNSQRTEVKTVLSKSKLKLEQINLLGDREWVEKQYVELKRSSVDIAKELGCHDSSVRRYVSLHNFDVRNYSQRSQWELKICKWLDEQNIYYIHCDRSVLDGQEIDIYIPDHKLAIEVNGLLYHSYNPFSFHITRIQSDDKKKEQSSRHLNKTVLAEKKNVQLLQFTDNQLSEQSDIVFNIIASKLRLHKKIGARKCELRVVSSDEQKQFFNRTHVQGYIPGSIAYGLYYENNLIQCVSVGKNRYRKNELEILRFSSELSLTVVGGLSKIMNRISNDFPNEIITSYCDRNISVGSGYVSAGFEIVGYTKPGYFWTDGRTPISRYKTQKNKLKQWLNGFNPSDSETVNMFRAGYLRYWNTGNIILKYKKK